MVVPGTRAWSDAEIQYQARNVAGYVYAMLRTSVHSKPTCFSYSHRMVTHNVSFNCIAGKVLVLDKDWPQREAFTTAVKDVLSKTKLRKALRRLRLLLLDF